MFSLVISIIAIALVAVLAIATIYYGTTAYQDQKIEAGAAQIINESEQIEGAILAFNIEEGRPPVICDQTDSNCDEPLQELIDYDYLKSAPVSSNNDEKWAIAVIVNNGGTNDVEALVKTVPLLECETANINMNFPGVTDYNANNGSNPDLNKANVATEADVNDLVDSTGDFIPQCHESMPSSVVCCATI
jgi:type II secretory pathway pseudopilin PulG